MNSSAKWQYIFVQIWQDIHTT